MKYFKHYEFVMYLTFSNCSADQHASIQPMTPLEEDEGVSGTSATMQLNGVGIQVDNTI